MSVWISDEKLLIFASLISPSKMIRHRQDLEVRQKYSAVRRIFNSLLGVSSGDETLHLMFDILLQITVELKFIYLILDKLRLNIPVNFAIPRPSHFFCSISGLGT